MDSNKQEKPLVLASAEENRQVTRRLLDCLGGFPGLPGGRVSYGMLAPNKPGVALTADQGAVITRRYILGGHRAEYTFALLSRVKAGGSEDKRLRADELLDALGDWACTQLPDLGEGARPLGFQVMQRAAWMDVWPNGDENHQILMKFSYERNVN